ncbi:MAG TPA: hypothetical protein VF069_28195 [Streptosporangiaceae bacterium]
MPADAVPPLPAQGATLRERLRGALRTAMKSRDRVALGALRSTLAAIDNAEAVEVDASAGRNLAIELTPVGAGAAEAQRRVLAEADVERIVRAETAAREASARDYEAAGRPERAEHLRAEARVLLAHLDEHTRRT